MHVFKLRHIFIRPTVKDWNSALICSTIYFGEKEKNIAMYLFILFECSLFFPGVSGKNQENNPAVFIPW